MVFFFLFPFHCQPPGARCLVVESNRGFVKSLGAAALRPMGRAVGSTMMDSLRCCTYHLLLRMTVMNACIFYGRCLVGCSNLSAFRRASRPFFFSFGCAKMITVICMIFVFFMFFVFPLLSFSQSVKYAKYFFALIESACSFLKCFSLVSWLFFL